ncbi:Protein LIFEGUARD 2 [Trifolium repens]|nr:Protein LIFEGUARD 2 [Trifolium repens]
MSGKNDIESGERTLYPMMNESPELRWSFIRKVYTIITFQLLLTIAVASVVVFVHPVANFLSKSIPGFFLYFFISLILAIITLCLLCCYHQKHPLNYFLLLIFTVSMAFPVGMTCSYAHGKVILESIILTAAVVFSLTLYTFWAVKRGRDFSFLGPFLFGALIVLILFGVIQILFPLGKLSHMIYGCLGAIIFCGYIVYDTNNLIKKYSYDEFIWASVSLYLDVINLFISLVTLFSAAD